MKTREGSEYDFADGGWWKDWQDQPHEGSPRDPADASAIWVQVSSSKDAEDDQYFWAYTLQPFEDWAEWWVYVAGLMINNYGMELTDG